LREAHQSREAKEQVGPSALLAVLLGKANVSTPDLLQLSAAEQEELMKEY